VNPVTNKIYVTNSNSNNVTVIDGATNTTATVTVGTGPFRVAVNPVTNKIYVTNQGSGTVTVIDGATNTTSSVTAGTNPQFVAVNAATNKIYVTNSGSANVTVINGDANEVGGTTAVSATVTAGNTPGQVAINPITNQIYVANLNSGNVTVISAEQTQPALLTTTITPIAGGVTASTTPIFTFTSNSAFSPTAPSVENVYFQLDGTDGTWIAATAGTGNFTGTPASALQFGTHIVYAFATDGQDVNSGGMRGSSEGADVIFIGSITAQVFTVTPPPSTTVTLTSNNNPAQTGQSVTFTAVVTSSSAGTPTGTVTFNDGVTLLGTGPLNGSATATFTTSSLAAASHSITAVYGGDTNFSGSTSAVLTEVVTPPQIRRLS
jgi:YVTN family beta-propeller protein